MVVENSEK